MDERVRDALEDMRDHAREIQTLVAGKDVRRALDDRVLQLACERLLEILGEAAARVPEFARASIPVPWKKVVGLRNRLIHAYDDTDPRTLVEIIEVHMPRLVAELDRALLERSG